MRLPMFNFNMNDQTNPFRSAPRLALSSKEYLEFYEQTKDRALKEAMLSEELFEAAIGFFSTSETLERLNFHPGFTKYNPFDFSYGFMNEDGSTWQHRFDQPAWNEQKGKIRKYESEKGGGSKLYRPPIPPTLRFRIGKRFDVKVPLTGSFWKWFMTAPEAKRIPLVLTEGGWKTNASIETSVVAASLYGKDAAFQKGTRSLIPDLKEVAMGRRILIALDRDQEPKTMEEVEIATSILGEALTAYSSSVEIVEWDARDGKGIDDLICETGVEAYYKALEVATPFGEWKRRRQKADLKRRWQEYTFLLPDYEAHAPRMTECGIPLPNWGESLLLDGAMSLERICKV